MTDGLSTLYQDLLGGSYDCVDRIVLNAYFRMGHDPGGFRVWWRALTLARFPRVREGFFPLRAPNGVGKLVARLGEAFSTAAATAFILGQDFNMASFLIGCSTVDGPPRGDRLQSAPGSTFGRL